MRRRLILAPALLSALIVLGCRSHGAGNSPAPSASSSAAAPLVLVPLGGSWRVELPVPGYRSATVVVPLGARGPRPVVIALHGDSDRPEWQCGTWNGILDRHAFVLCPRGIPRADAPPDDARFTFGAFTETSSELRAALKALKARFGAHVSSGPVVLAGYTLGAVHAVALLRQEPAFFSRAVLVDGGFESWGSTLADVFVQGGGQRLLFVCTTRGCGTEAAHQVYRTERAGAEAKLIDAGARGQGLDAGVAAAIREGMSWLVAGDARWAGVYERSSAPLASARPAPGDAVRAAPSTR